MTALEVPPHEDPTAEVIDLRQSGLPTGAAAPGTAGPDSADSGPADTEPARASSPADRFRGRRIVLAVLLALIGIVVVDIVFGSVAHTERQRHLADEFRERDGAADLRSGDASSVIQAPDIGLNQVVIEDATAAHLRGGPARRLDSATPGGGNTVIMGRSSRFSGPFDHLDDLAEGNLIALQSRDGGVVEYEVSSIERIAGDETEVLRDDGTPRLTLITSSGGPLSSRRLVVTATPVGVEPAADDPADDPAEERDVAPDASEGRDGAAEPPLGFDLREGGRILLLAGLVVMALGGVVAWELRRRYSPLTIVAVAGPAVALGLALFLFNLDGFLPTTY